MLTDQASPHPGERLPRWEKLRQRMDYQRCYRKGQRRHGRLISIHFAPNEHDHPRVGITVTKKVGKAVVRQRLKRRTREIYRRWSYRRELPALDMVIHFKPAAQGSGFAALRDEVRALVRKAVKDFSG